MIDNINYHLPSIEGSSRSDALERERARELSLKYALLNATETYNTGEGTVILASATDGFGRFDALAANEHSFVGHTLAGKLLESGCGGIELVDMATSADLQDAIQDLNVANIFLLGHSSYHSWVASDGSVDWYRTGKMVDDHLKNGVFANLGCGAINSWNFIPLGRYAVGSKGLLLGKSKELTTVAEMTDLSKFAILK